MNIKHIKKINNIYAELYEDDKQYGKKIERPQSDLHKRRPLKNLKKAWEAHMEDYDAVDDFYETH